MIERDMDRFLQLGFSSLQEASICVLMAKGPISIAEIVTRQGRHTTSVTRNILRLIDKNMVVKVESERSSVEGVGRPTKFLYELTAVVADSLAGVVAKDSDATFAVDRNREI